MNTIKLNTENFMTHPLGMFVKFHIGHFQYQRQLEFGAMFRSNLLEGDRMGIKRAQSPGITFWIHNR